MYFLIGGRRTQGGLYRVTYTGNEPTCAANMDNDGQSHRNLRRNLEKYHGVKDPKAVNEAWKHLGSDDRFLRSAARTAL